MPELYHLPSYEDQKDPMYSLSMVNTALKKYNAVYNKR